MSGRMYFVTSWICTEFRIFAMERKWRVLFPQKSAGLKDCGYGIWKLRAEGTESFKRYGSGEFIQSWDWLRTMRQVNRLFLSEKIKK